MHYYKFNIPDWILHTSHLSPEEEGIYFRLLNHFYDTESPIPTETQPVFRRLWLTGNEDKASAILKEFFQLEDGFWHHKRCEKEILSYQAKATTNKANGSKGGRPKVSGDSQVKPKKPKKTQSVNSGNPDKTLTSNQEPSTNNQEPSSKSKKEKYSDDDYLLAKFMSERINLITAIDPDLKAWARTIRLIRERDKHNHHDICQVFVWANNDDFWRTNILSPVKLRKQYPQLFAKMNQEVSHGTYQQSGGQGRLSAVDRVHRHGQELDIEIAAAEAEEALADPVGSAGGDLWPSANQPVRGDDAGDLDQPPDGILIN